jgi:hypothetical protein
MFSGIPDSVKLKNADGTTGRESQSMLASFSLATEDFAVLTAISTQTGQFQFVGGRLKVDAALDASSITIGSVQLRDGVSGTLATIRSVGADNALVVVQDSQPLPTGASTEATLAAANTTLSSILSGMATAANQGTEITHLTSIDGKLPATLGQGTMAQSLSVAIASNQSSIPVTATQAGSWTFTLGAGTAVIGHVIVDSGSIAATQAGGWNVAILAGAATIGAVTQAGTWNVGISAGANLIGSAKLADSAGNLVTSQTSGSQRALDVGVNVAGVQVDPRAIRALTATDSITAVQPTAANFQATVTQTGTWNVGLNAGANLIGSVKLDDGSGVSITSQASGLQRALDVGINVAGAQVDPRAIRALTGADIVTAAQATAANLNATVFQGGAWTVGIGAGTAVIGHVIVDSGAVVSSQGTAAAIAGAWPVKLTDGTNTVSVTASGSLLVSGLSAVGVSPSLNPVSVSGVDGGGLKRHILTDATGKIEVDSISGTISLPTGASTSANQATAQTSLTSIDGKLTHGQATMANSVPSVPASDYVPPTAADLSASGLMAALNTTVVLAVHGTSSTLISIGGTWVGTIQIQGQAPDGTWANLSTKPIPAGGNVYTTNAIASNGNYRVLTTAAYQAIRSLMATFTSGSASINIFSSVAVSAVEPVQTIAANLNAQVVGTVADGAATSANSVTVGGKDGSGNARTISTDASGRQNVDLFDGSGNALTSAVTSDGGVALDITQNPSDNACYMASTNGTVTSGTTAATVTSLAYLFHGAGTLKRYEITKITASIIIGQGNIGDLTLRVARITAENGTPGGATQTVNAVDSSDAASAATFRTAATGAPTRATGDLVTQAFDVDTTAQGGGTSNNSTITLFDMSAFGKPLVIRNGVSEGWEVRSIVGAAITTGVKIAITYFWREV